MKSYKHKFHWLLSIVLFLLGVGLRYYYKDTPGLCGILGDLGTFIAATISIRFLYNYLSKDEDRELFLSDLRMTLIDTFREQSNKRPIIHQQGRRSIEEKVKLFKEAKTEVIEVGLAVNTLVQYFTSRPYGDFKAHVEACLNRGVNFKFFVLDPRSPAARLFEAEPDGKGTINKIQRSTDSLQDLKKEFAKYPGNFKIFWYSLMPKCHIMIVDRNTEDARAFVSHYIPGVTRADTPVIEFDKSSSHLMINHYNQFIEILKRNSQEVF